MQIRKNPGSVCFWDFLWKCFFRWVGVMQAFSEFINDQSLNQKQIAFVYKVIKHIENNGYMESVAELQKPPFDKPISFVKLFDQKRRVELVNAINRVKDNAVVIAV